eukprot:1160825-Pelagomonas_calceolata.AAC.10
MESESSSKRAGLVDASQALVYQARSTLRACSPCSTPGPSSTRDTEPEFEHSNQCMPKKKHETRGAFQAHSTGPSEHAHDIHAAPQACPATWQALKLPVHSHRTYHHVSLHFRAAAL